MATIYDIMNSNTGRMTQKMGGTPISTPTVNPTNINYGTVLTGAQAGIKPTTTKTKKSTDPFKAAREKALNMTTEEKQNLFKKGKTGNKKIDKALKDIEEEKVGKGPTTVNNALFVGSTAELAKLLKQQPKNEDI